MQNKDRKIAEEQIVNNIMTGKQVLQELSKIEIEENGGLSGLICQVKYNIVESLRAYGLDCWVASVLSVDTEQTKDFNDFSRRIQQNVVVCY